MRRRMSAEYFEELYRADPDPWDLASSDYERGKYAVTLAALDGRRYARGLEVGCSIGTLSERLAGCCDELVAIDGSPRAVAAARARLGRLPNVSVIEGAVPGRMPEGRFDLVVCSEVLYYWDAPGLRSLWALLRDAVAPGGSLLAVHWRGPVRHYPLDGDTVHELIADDPGDLARVRTGVWPRFRLDRFDRPA